MPQLAFALFTVFCLLWACYGGWCSPAGRPSSAPPTPVGVSTIGAFVVAVPVVVVVRPTPTGQIHVFGRPLDPPRVEFFAQDKPASREASGRIGSPGATAP